MAKKITFNTLSNNFDYTTDTTPIEAEIANKQAKVTDAEKNHIAMFNDLGQTVDSGFSTDDFRKKSETVNIDDVENLSDIIAEKMTANDVQAMIEATHSEEPWGADSNANDYTTSGVYQFAGWRKNQNDNLPITNYDEDDVDRNNVAFTLIVNTKEGYLVRNDEGNVTRNIPTMIAQTLMLGNRRGSDTKIYTRHGQTDLATNTTTWEAWREVMTSTYLDIVDSYTGDVLNATTEIGLYTGAMVDLASNVADVFKLEVINNYAVTTQVSAATGASVHNSVLQTITILNLDGNNTTKKRIGTYNGTTYTWSEWKENTSGSGTSESTTKFKTGDVVYLVNPHYSGGRIGIVKFEDFIKNVDDYRPSSSDISYESKKVAIGLIADPIKRTFCYLRTLPRQVYKNEVEKKLLDGYTSFTDGEETHDRIKQILNQYESAEPYFPSFYTLEKDYNALTWTYSLFYGNTVGPKIKSYVPALYEIGKTGLLDEKEEYGNKCIIDYVISLLNYPSVYFDCYGKFEDNGGEHIFYTLSSTIARKNTTGIDNSFKCIDVLSGIDYRGDYDSTKHSCAVFGIYTEEDENNE